MNAIRRLLLQRWTVLFGSVVTMGALANAAKEPSTVQSVKEYLVKTVGSVKEASADFRKNAETYQAIIEANGGNYEKAVQADGAKLDELIVKMQENYKAMDSYGYETVEGIVAGVDSLAKYDVYLDAGVPEGEGAPDEVAPVKLTLKGGKTMDRKGALFTYIIEPSLWKTASEFLIEVPGKGSYPRAEVLVAAAVDTDETVGKLLQDSQAWQPSAADCFGALIVMTPTLSDYFEDWKESRFSDNKSGRFNAVSRVSDMRGIMKSCAVMYDAVNSPVAAKDEALSRSINGGFTEILAFLDKIAEREKTGAIQAVEVDELAAQAKAKTDKLVPQIEQAAVLVEAKAE